MIDEITKVHFDSWKVTYESYYPTRLLEIVDFDYIKRIWLEVFDEVELDQRVALVALDQGQVIGHVDVGFNFDLPLFELARLYLRVDMYRQGLGKKLLDAACNVAIAAGRTDGMMWVVPDNVDARRFYVREGWYDSNEHATIDGDGWSIPEMRYRKSFS